MKLYVTEVVHNGEMFFALALNFNGQSTAIALSPEEYEALSAEQLIEIVNRLLDSIV